MQYECSCRASTMLIQLTLLFCCIVPHISYVCRDTGRKIPEDGQIFYIRLRDTGSYRNWNRCPNDCPPTNNWLKKASYEYGDLTSEYVDEDQLLESGDFKFEWHDCNE